MFREICVYSGKSDTLYYYEFVINLNLIVMSLASYNAQGRISVMLKKKRNMCEIVRGKSGDDSDR